MALPKILFIRPRNLITLVALYTLILTSLLIVTSASIETAVGKMENVGTEPGQVNISLQIILAISTIVSTFATSLFAFLTAKDRHRTELAKIEATAPHHSDPVNDPQDSGEPRKGPHNIK